MEFTFDVDAAQLPCGLNGALYFSEMLPDGGSSEFGDPAGANYGVGYCDAQCPHDIKFIEGQANAEGWTASQAGGTGGGKFGSCCAEMDIWEANTVSTALTVHPCSTNGPTKCEGTACGDNDTNQRYDGVCDKDGCDLAPYRLGEHNFYGPGSQFTVDSTQPMTVITQFITEDGTDNSDVVEIKRKYVQNGKVFEMPEATVGDQKFNSITDAYCQAQKDEFGDVPDFQKKGGLKQMSKSYANGMTLVMSLWDDSDVNMRWLDSISPKDANPNKPGVKRGTCPIDSGNPWEMENQYPNSYVVYSNIRIGELDSTYGSNYQQNAGYYLQ